MLGGQKTSALLELVSDFRLVTSFRDQNAPKTTGAENRGQISDFSAPVRIRGGMREMSEWTKQVQSTTQPLIYTFTGAPLHGCDVDTDKT